MWFPTLREQGANRCEHYDPEEYRGPLVTVTGIRRVREWRCGWCGAHWDGRRGRWIGGSLDFPQQRYGVPETWPAESAA